MGMQHKKDSEDPVVLTHNGVAFYIMTNFGKYKAFWTYDNIEGGILGVESE